MIKKLILAWTLCLAAVAPSLAAGGGAPWDKFPAERTKDLAALQNGAKLFANYCLNCHQASFMRYNRMRDIGLTDEQIKQNLIFTDAKVGDLMTTAMTPKDAKEWLAAAPPDLTLVTRSRSGAQGSGSDYVYTFLRSFYRDDSRPTGWNNAVFPSTGMPHVLWELQGQNRPVVDAQTHQVKGYEALVPGTMTADEFNRAAADIVAYMTWMAEPMAQTRVRLGVWVLIFLAVFTVIAWKLNAVYWKDVR